MGLQIGAERYAHRLSVGLAGFTLDAGGLLFHRRVLFHVSVGILHYPEMIMVFVQGSKTRRLGIYTASESASRSIVTPGIFCPLRWIYWIYLVVTMTIKMMVVVVGGEEEVGFTGQGYQKSSYHGRSIDFTYPICQLNSRQPKKLLWRQESKFCVERDGREEM